MISPVGLHRGDNAQLTLLRDKTVQLELEVFRPWGNTVIIKNLSGGYESELASEVLHECGVRLGDWISSLGLEPLISNTQEQQLLHKICLAGGGRVVATKRHVGTCLTAALPKLSQQLSYCSFADLPRPRFLAALAAASQGDPFDDNHDDEDLADLINLAGNRFDPTSWVVAQLDGEDAAVVLPQINPDHPSEGSLYYLGVIPKFRGRGLGQALHAYGLHRLQSDGAQRYVGSTDVRNQAMLSIFSKNGCSTMFDQLSYSYSRIDHA